ncbi:MAG: hypothetical protein IJU19_06165 [Bacteroidales bacterium]|nr:hypothetical protein [Bacteroidales bacterium]
MRGKLAIGMLCVLLLGTMGSRAQLALGQWTDCFDFESVGHVAVAGETVYAAGATGMYAFHKADQSVEVMGKAWGMSDTRVAAMAYDPQTACLAVAYTNSNIDLLQGGLVYNLPDIKRSTLSGDKSINSISFHGGYAYLSASFGVVVVDIKRHEIKETWYLGADGGSTPVYDIAFSSDSIYAATGEGLKVVALAERHPGISSRWRVESSLAGITIPHVVHFGGSLVAAGYSASPDSMQLLILSPTGRDNLPMGNIRALHVGGDVLAVSTNHGVWRYDSHLALKDSLTLYDGWADLQASDAVEDGEGCLWVAHRWLGLVRLCPWGNSTFIPNGPATGENVYRLVPAGKQMLLCPGGHTTIYASSYIAPNLGIADGLEWKTLRLGESLPSGGSDIVAACINPVDSSEMLAALWGTGVASIRDGRVATLYDETNTGGVLHRYVVGDFGTLRVGAMTFAPDGTLWAVNSSSPAALVARKPDGSWKSFSTEYIAPMLEVDKLLRDSITGYLWFAGRNNAIYVHDGVSRIATVNPNNGSRLQTQTVNAIVQDREGSIWVGTDQGIKVVYDGGRVFAGGGMGEVSPVVCSNITISDRGIYEYLMAYENITAIAVDGANRKWVGTASGGLYLLSADGLTQLRHFTAAESPLLSDKITTLAIQPHSGLLYIGTDRGVQIYRSDATEATGEPEETVYAFPNPVRPGYDGPVAIKGLARDALVHITDAAGHTVFTTQALGGQAIWRLRTDEGERVAAGVYYVFAATAEASGKSVTKILVIR